MSNRYSQSAHCLGETNTSEVLSLQQPKDLIQKGQRLASQANTYEEVSVPGIRFWPAEPLWTKISRDLIFSTQEGSFLQKGSEEKSINFSPERRSKKEAVFRSFPTLGTNGTAAEFIRGTEILWFMTTADPKRADSELRGKQIPSSLDTASMELDAALRRSPQPMVPPPVPAVQSAQRWTPTPAPVTASAAPTTSVPKPLVHHTISYNTRICLSLQCCNLCYSAPISLWYAQYHANLLHHWLLRLVRRKIMRRRVPFSQTTLLPSKLLHP